MELHEAHESMTSGLDESYLKRTVSVANVYRSRADIFNGRARPGGPASASKTIEDLAELTRLDTSVDVPLVLLDNMHPPCAASVDSLRKVNISDLKVHTRPRGSVLIARKIGVAAQTWSRLLAGLQDETGNTCILIFNQRMRDIPAEEFIPEGATLAIKEPYLHVDMIHSPHEVSNNAETLKSMFFAIRVDNPGDLVVLPLCDTLVPSQFRTSKPVGTAASWKESGNAAFSSGRFLEAHRCYTEGIRLMAGQNDSPELLADLLRNRSRTGISLHFYDDARSDALRSSSLLSSTSDRAAELNTKALFRAATAAYNLDDYQGSNSILSQLHEMAPNDNAAASLGKKIRFRLREQAHGTYNFDQLRKSAESSGHVDVASFLLRTEIRTDPLNGLGLFATQDVKAGEIIFCEKAFSTTPPQDGRTQPAHLMSISNRQVAVLGTYFVALWKNVVERATRNKSIAHRLNDLAETGHLAYAAPSVGAEDDVFLMYKRVQRSSHAITRAGEATVNMKQGLFVHASRINHSCMPNTARADIGNLLVVRASRAIRAGEQLFSCDIHLFDDYEQTKKFISKTLKCHCECAICVAEEQTSPQQRLLRQEALKLVATYCKKYSGSKNHASKAELDRALSEGVQLASKLSATYDDNTFQGVMPRRGLSELYSALADIHLKLVRSGKHPEPKELTNALNSTMQAIQAQGCKIAVDPSGNVSFSNLHGVQNFRTYELLTECVLTAAEHARYKTAKQFMGYAKEIYLLEHTETADFLEKFAWLENIPAINVNDGLLQTAINLV